MIERHDYDGAAVAAGMIERHDYDGGAAVVAAVDVVVVAAVGNRWCGLPTPGACLVPLVGRFGYKELLSTPAETHSNYHFHVECRFPNGSLPRPV